MLCPWWYLPSKQPSIGNPPGLGPHHGDLDPGHRSVGGRTLPTIGAPLHPPEPEPGPGEVGRSHGGGLEDCRELRFGTQGWGGAGAESNPLDLRSYPSSGENFSFFFRGFHGILSTDCLTFLMFQENCGCQRSKTSFIRRMTACWSP